MPFKEIGRKHQNRVDGPPKLTVFESANQLGGYLNAAAVYTWLDGSDAVGLQADVEYSRLGIDPEPGAETTTYTLSGEGAGKSLSLSGALFVFDVTADTLSETHVTALEYDGEHGLVIAELSAAVEDATDAVHCPECGKRCANEQGLRAHSSKIHDNPRKALEDADPDEFGEDVPDGDDSWQDYSNRGESA